MVLFEVLLLHAGCYSDCPRLYIGVDKVDKLSTSLQRSRGTMGKGSVSLELSTFDCAYLKWYMFS